MITTTEHASVRPDLWGEPREWEEQYGPGELLDGWRFACATLETLAEMNTSAGSRHEMLYIAVTDALERSRAEARHFGEEVAMRLEWNKTHGRLTPFGRVIGPMMERAGISSAAELLYAAGKMEEPHATEILERLMHGPKTTHNLGNYLTGFPEALGLPEGEEGDRPRRRLSSSLASFISPEHAEKVAREAEAEAEDDCEMPPPARDAAGPLSDANAALSDAVDRLERTDGDSPEVRERKRLASMAVSEAGGIVAGEQTRQEREREGGGR